MFKKCLIENNKFFKPEDPKVIMKKFNILIEKDEDGYFVSEVVELPGCHTQAKSMDELLKRTREAIILYLKCQEPTFFVEPQFIGLQQIEI